MNSFDKFNVLDILIATPYAARSNLSGLLSEDFFFEHFFYESKSFNEILLRLDKYLESKSYQLPFFCFLEGYAGTGKTTFLHWFIRNSKIKMNHALIDLSTAKTDTHAKGDHRFGDDLFEDYFIKLWPRIYRNFKIEVEDLLAFLCKESDLLTSYFSKDFFIKLKEYFKSDKEPPTTSTEFIQFLNNIVYTEMLVMFMLMYNRYPRVITLLPVTSNDVEIKDDCELLLFIDNIDSMKMEAKSSEIPREIANCYYSYYTPIINEFNKYFSINRKINFVFCMRDSVFSIINPQFIDYIQKRYLHFGIDSDLASEVFDKRIGFSKKNGLIRDPIQYRFIENAHKDRLIFNRSYLPLFNYNLRKLSLFLADTALEISEKDINCYEKIADHSNSFFKVGARGIYFFLIINTMKHRDFISNNLITKEGQPTKTKGNGLLNISRIILTIIHNRTQYDLNSNSRIENLTESNLFDIYTTFSELFENHIDEFVDTLSNLFLFYEHNWCHLITLKNISIFDNSSMDEVKEKLKRYEKLYKSSNQRDKNDVKKLKQSLSNIKIRINSAGFIYLKDIIRHYEYHSVKSGNEKALFLCTGVDYRWGKSNYVYEFEKSLENAKNATFSCIESLKNFLANSDYPFEWSACCFRLYTYGENSIVQDGEYDHIECYEHTRNGQLLINRIIDTHTNYIDCFRNFLVNDQENMKKICEITGKSSTEIKLEINEKIIKVLNEYVSRYYINKDKRLAELKQFQINNLIEIAKEANMNKYDRFINTNRSQQLNI